MIGYKATSLIALAIVLTVAQAVAEPAWAKKPPPQGQTQLTQSDKCPGGVSKGCSPGSCRCP